MDFKELEERKKIVVGELLEAERALENSKSQKKQVDEEIKVAQDKLKDLKPLKERAKDEYKEVATEVIGKNRRAEEITEGIRTIKSAEVKILARLEDEIKEKTRILNSFKAQKKDFIKSLDKREEDLNAKDYSYFTRLEIFNEKERDLTERETELAKGLILLEKNKGGIRLQESQLNATQRQIEGLKHDTEADRDKALKLKQEIEGELAKQEKITEILGERGKILDSQDEILHKREDILKNRRELIKKEKGELDEMLGSFDKQKEKKLAELRNLTEDTRKALDDFVKETNKLKGIENEIAKAETDKRQAEEELQQRIDIEKQLIEDIEIKKTELEELQQQKLRIYESIEAETSKKSKEFERFAAGKKALLQRIDDKEREIARKEEGLKIISGEIAKNRELLKVDLSFLADSKKKLDRQEAELETKRYNIEKKEREAEAFLSEAKKIKEKRDKEALKQSKFAKELEDKEKILSSQEEVLNKTKEFLNKKEKQLEKDQAKLDDDRRSLNRAIVDRR